MDKLPRRTAATTPDEIRDWELSLWSERFTQSQSRNLGLAECGLPERTQLRLESISREGVLPLEANFCLKLEARA